MRYRAFISYSSADRIIGERFQRAIEHYRIPRPLRGTDRGFGTIPKYLTPLFRDRSDATAGGNLGEVLERALAGSDALVVLCSPAAARSEWVNKEIRRFRQLGRGDRIVAVLVAGTPDRYDSAAAPEGAFPPALFERVDPSGQVVGLDGPEPLGADLRPEADGFDLAKLKVVSALTGVPLTEVTQRQLEAERRDRRIVRGVASALGVLALAAGVAAVLAYRSAEAARTRLSNAIEIAARRVDDGARYGDRHGVPADVVRELLAGAQHDFQTLVGDAPSGAPLVELQRARVMLLLSRHSDTVGDPAAQLKWAREGLATLERIPSRRQVTRPETWFATLPEPGQVRAERFAALEELAAAMQASGQPPEEVRRELEAAREEAERAGDRAYVARFWSLLGEHHYAGGELDRALAAHTEALQALERAGGDTEERTRVMAERAEVLFESGRLEEALAEQDRVVSLYEAAQRATPTDARVSQSLGAALTRRGDMRYALHNTWAGSRNDFERARTVLEQAHASDPSRMDFARQLSITLERMGDVLLQEKQYAPATDVFTRMMALRRTRAARDTSSDEARRDLAVGLERLADLALATDNPPRALQLLQEAAALRGGSAAAPDAGDLVAVRDRAITWWKIGEARVAARTGDWAAAYEEAIAGLMPRIRDQTAPIGWLRDAAVFHNAYARALAGAGRTADARHHWTAALALVDRQLALAPDSATQLQVDRDQLVRALAAAPGRAVPAHDAGKKTGPSARRAAGTRTAPK